MEEKTTLEVILDILKEAYEEEMEEIKKDPQFKTHEEKAIIFNRMLTVINLDSRIRLKIKEKLEK